MPKLAPLLIAFVALAVMVGTGSAEPALTPGDYITSIDDDGIAAIAIARTEPHVVRYLTIPSRTTPAWEVRSDVVGGNPAPDAGDFVFRDRYCAAHYVVVPIIVPKNDKDGEVDQPRILVDLGSRRMKALGEDEGFVRPRAASTPCIGGSNPIERSAAAR